MDFQEIEVFNIRLNFQISKLLVGFKINSNGFSRDRSFQHHSSTGLSFKILIFFLSVKNVQTRVELMLEVVPLVLEFAVHVRYQKLFIKLQALTNIGQYMYSTSIYLSTWAASSVAYFGHQGYWRKCQKISMDFLKSLFFDLQNSVISMHYIKKILRKIVS